ncbi:MAG TPA: hypothetical protein VNA22_04505 [Pyrinomonadaceae bacterium]|nr:hypothetical protein [Pyrinomonadaceae bacterium]
MYLKPCILALILIIAATAAGQKVAEKKPTEAEEKLRKEAVAFLRETLTEVNAMRSLENRISFTAELAALMWYHDEREARSMYVGVIADFKDLLRKYDTQMNAFAVVQGGDPLQEVTRFDYEPSAEQMVLRKYAAALGVRQQIATGMSEHDPDLAFGFFYDSIGVISSAELLKQHQTRDLSFVHQLVGSVAEKDPGKAIKYAVRSLSDGVDYQHIEVLTKIHSKDPDKGAEFASAMLSRLKDEDPKKLNFWSLDNLINFAEEKLTDSKKAGGKRPPYSASEIRDLAEILARSILARDMTDGMSSAHMYVELIGKYLPSRAAQIRAKFDVGETDDAPLGRSMRAVANYAANAVSNAALYAANSNANSNSYGRVPDERETPDKKLFDDIEKLGTKQFPKAERDKIVGESRKIIMQAGNRDQKITRLGLLASQVARAGDKELAAEIMGDAEKLVSSAPRNYRDFMLTWLLASGHAFSNPERAFPLLEETIGRANETIAAFVKVGEFMDITEETVLDGEVQVGAFGGRMLSGLTGELAMADDTIQVLAIADFGKTKNLTNRFDRAEIRVLSKMMVLRAVLKPKEEPKMINPEPAMDQRPVEN